uniref:PDEase domain-containing protein n=1 Tax=Chromera velia CCMP2878 TaxID=1169474 RepID=A0A0G4H4Z0_9ALVE|eukprot:Cvel_855.t1-p1 / transcript=Cvel_855.t1 / gene=Cvel_855 / organism=Chromera_velia_CCMP2878 / gene_product=cAMP-specific 3',5'-cyclic phosphodiesterase,, putative / transcript_product=cAMP-specific 3',5'-cyclic phosphodiesterase,, putative / location=Cvel_scaffold26:172584-180110(-) / protein_length=1002 / sequence_SO=supercontig / SO=protein_coding / is_pseudo=false
MVRAYSWQDTMGGLAGGVCADRKGKGRDTQSASDFDSRNEQVPTHKYSGYFLDPDTETDFIRSHQGKKRVWLLCATLVFVLISIVDLAAGTGNGWVGGDEGIDLAQRVGTFLSYLILGSVALWYPFSPASFEKVVAAGILLWVFSVTLLSDDIVRPTSADEGYMILAILIALNIMFVGLFLIALPLRRPVLIFVIGGVCAILAVACVIISVVNRSNPEIVLDASSGIMAVAIVLVAIGFGLAREEHACRVMLFRARYQKMKIAHLMEERDELIRVKKTGQQAGFSSAERLVELVAGAIEDLRWQENVLRHHAWGGDCTTSKRMAETTRRTIKELTETAALASHAESLMQVDVQQLWKPCPQCQQQMVKFFQENFMRGRIQDGLNVARHRRSSVFFQGNAEAPPPADVLNMSTTERVSREVHNLLHPFEQILPLTLAKPRTSTREETGRTNQIHPQAASEVPAREWNLDVRELEEKESTTSQPFAPRKMSCGMDSLLRVKNSLPILRLHLLQPYLTDVLGVSDLSEALKFLCLVEANYLKEPKYHNAVHGAEVALMSVWLTEHSGARRLLSGIQNVSVVIAALCHDLGHPAVNDQFLVNSGSEVALMYNDRSVLENFNAAKTFLVLKTPGCELLAHLEKEDQQLARSAIIDLILNTDMKKHFEFVSALKLLINSPGFAPTMAVSAASQGGEGKMERGQKAEEREKDQQEAQSHVWTVTRACLKAADLGHSAKPWPIHLARSLCVVSEFFDQGDREKSLGLPVSPLCNRTDTSPIGMCRSQVGFLTFVCRELPAERRKEKSKGSEGDRGGARGRDQKEKGTGNQRSSIRSSREGSSGGGVIASVCLSNLDSNVEAWKRPETVDLLQSSLFEDPQLNGDVSQSGGGEDSLASLPSVNISLPKNFKTILGLNTKGPSGPPHGTTNSVGPPEPKGALKAARPLLLEESSVQPAKVPYARTVSSDSIDLSDRINELPVQEVQAQNRREDTVSTPAVLTALPIESKSNA